MGVPRERPVGGGARRHDRERRVEDTTSADTKKNLGSASCLRGPSEGRLRPVYKNEDGAGREVLYPGTQVFICLRVVETLPSLQSRIRISEPFSLLRFQRGFRPTNGEVSTLSGRIGFSCVQTSEMVDGTVSRLGRRVTGETRSHSSGCLPVPLS